MSARDAHQRARRRPRRARHAYRALVTALVATLVAALVATLLAGCSAAVTGHPTIVSAPDVNLHVTGTDNGAFDVAAQNALSDVMAFWKVNFPKIDNGTALPPLTGKLYSVDGDQVVKDQQLTGPAADEACLSNDPAGILDNAFYCSKDDSIVWDRAPDHLVPLISTKYGKILIAMVFAHEFGHAIQQRLGILDQDLPTIETESQADCASGAFTASVLAGQAPHFRVTPPELDEALDGYLLIRDQTPTQAGEISHGNGFDRLSALDDGIQHGVAYCYSTAYLNRGFTARAFQTDTDDGIQDTQRGGNEPQADVLNPAAGGLLADLNTYWGTAAKSVNHTFSDVKTAAAATPKCGASTGSQFGYCPADNTVYYSAAFATKAYHSLSSLNLNQDTYVASVVENEPADYALGELFAIAWGMAVRHQLFNRSTDDQAALLSAVCYSGAYSASINVPTGTAGATFVLSAPDMDEATSAVLNLAGLDTAYGARGTTGLQRVQYFVTGYTGGLSAC